MYVINLHNFQLDFAQERFSTNSHVCILVQLLPSHMETSLEGLRDPSGIVASPAQTESEQEHGMLVSTTFAL